SRTSSSLGSPSQLVKILANDAKSRERTKLKDILSPTIESTESVMDISTPYNTIHVTHVGFDPVTGEFTGLPKEWQLLLTQSGITRQEQESNPQAVIHAIEFLQALKRFSSLRITKSKSDNLLRKSTIVTPTASTSSMASDTAISSKMTKKPQKQLEDDYLDDVRSFNSESTASFSEDCQGQPMHELTRTQDVLYNAPPGTVRSRAPKEEKRSMSDEQVLKHLQELCITSDPLLIYTNMVKIGQGASGGVYIAYRAGSRMPVAIKQMNLEKQPKKESIINEIRVMKESKAKNIVNFIESYLWKGDLWVVMEYMEGGSLTDVVTCNMIMEGQIAAICRE
ncbi:signal transducing kinase of the PAK, partial [Rhizopus stolonifer]